MTFKDEAERKKYQADYYQRNKEAYAVAAKARRKARNDYVIKLKSENPCVDCGKFYHYCQMQYDHIGTDKVTEVSKLVKNGTIDKIQAEIDKCELVCANCHALRSWQRLQ